MKVYLDSVGCRLNQSEIERYARQLHAAGHTLVSDPQNADWIIVNTCAVTSKADADSRQKIRALARCRADANVITVTGCWASLQPEAAASLPGVQQVVLNPDKDNLIPMLLARMDAQQSEDALTDASFDAALNEPNSDFTHPKHRTRSFIKVQDGCDHHCTFCVTARARGRSHSRPLEDTLREIQTVLDDGAQEIVLSGVNLGAWGKDLSDSEDGLIEGRSSSNSPLSTLIEIILARTSVPRLRLSSLEPWDLDDAFFRLWQDARLCRHLHLPLQSGCDRTLRRMGRHTDQASFMRLVEAVRKLSPQMAITTDIITGFPGETDEEFHESLAFVRRISFAAGHVFTYSERPGTPAVRMPNPVPYAVRKARNAEMRALFAEESQRYRQKFIGQTADVLWEHSQAGNDEWELSGLTDTYIRIRAHSNDDLWNHLSRVRLESLHGDWMRGTLLPSSS